MPSTTATPFKPSTLSSSQIRAMFIDFFKSKGAGGGAAPGHVFVPSSPCVPHDDPTLLFTNAGMNQFKPLFLGQADPNTTFGRMKRAVNSQKCIRAGGKHNDLDDVGKDTYHHTFFEMLGNWSFGDYFKKEAIDWAFELLTKVYGIPADRLYATYFGGSTKAALEPDLESRELWLKHLPPEHVIPGNMKDNFWEMGDTGPCGPCSEIHVDRIGGRDASKLVNTGDPDVIEIWNNVFIQFNREEGGTLRILPAKHVDTGMGFERLVSVLKNARSNYDTDVFTPLFVAIERATHARAYTGKLGAADSGNVDTAYRVIADHIRTLTFAITDGATPSNEGRGYVLRRILRRAVRYGRQCLGAKTGFFAGLVPVVVQQMGDAFPELKKNPARVQEIIRDEEESFARTLDRGIVLFDEACVRALTKTRLLPHHQTEDLVLSHSKDADGWTLAIHKRKGHDLVASAKMHQVTAEWTDSHFGPNRVVTGEDAFKLYDTFGFPFDLTKLMAEERGMSVDEVCFKQLMEQAKEKARAGGGKFAVDAADLSLDAEAIAKLKHMHVQPTIDADKFASKEIKATVKAIWDGEAFHDVAHSGGGAGNIAQCGLILDYTNFYAEMGGQVGDHGKIEVCHASGRDAGAEFRVEDTRVYGGYVVHVGRVSKKDIRVGDEVILKIDAHRRHAVCANHTATHLLNLGLRAALGEGVEQKGSLVAPDKLRFDFSHSKPVAPEELAAIEHTVLDQIRKNLAVHIETIPLAKAKSIAGVRAVFGEAYPDPVRVVSVGRTISELFDASGALKTSAEFCGGVHVNATGEIGRFVLVSEEGVAKGIRRITALSGVPAMAAVSAGEHLAKQLTAAERLTGELLAQETKNITAEIEQLTLPLVVKQQLRARMAALGEKIKAASKAASGASGQAQVAQAARSIASSNEWEMVPCIVSTIEAGSDRDALNAAINTVREVRPKHAVLLISPDEAEGKLNIIAAVPEALQKRGLKAGDWVKEVAAVAGGRGGGKPDMAQGGGTDLSKLKETLAAARSYAMSKCPC